MMRWPAAKLEAAAIGHAQVRQGDMYALPMRRREADVVAAPPGAALFPGARAGDRRGGADARAPAADC